MSMEEALIRNVKGTAARERVVVEEALPERVNLVVPKDTGTPGDDSIALGLAHVVNIVTGLEVRLDDAGNCFTITADGRIQPDAHRDPALPGRLRLTWIASTEKNKWPPEHLRSILAVKDRDVLKQQVVAQRAARAATAAVQSGGELGVAASAEVAVYSHYVSLMNPNPTWQGYNKIVELSEHLLTPAGIAFLFQAYDATQPIPAHLWPGYLQALGVPSGECWHNPPGLCFPTMAKGPTMRLRTLAGRSIGGGTTADWEMADRDDRALHEVFLAYRGYFNVAKISDSDDNRVVVVPALNSVPIPTVMDALRSVTVTSSTVVPFLVARTVLDYARAMLGLLAETQRLPADMEEREFVTALRGVHVTTYWKPNANTFAVDRRLLVPLPGWLLPLYRQHGDQRVPRETLEQHRRRLDNIRGAWRDEKKLGGAAREAIDRYLESLSGNAALWFRVVAAWFPAARERDGDRWTLWTEEEVRRIAVANDSKFAQTIDHPSFRAIADAIRKATVDAHFARRDRKHGRRVAADVVDAIQANPRSPFSAQYDLMNRLLESSDRDRKEFTQELLKFVVLYNEETMRNMDKVEDPRQRRRMIRETDLQHVLSEIEHDTEGLVPLALLAFGSSLRGKTTADQDDRGDDDETLSGNSVDL